jgi:hypothetical protein
MTKKFLPRLDILSAEIIEIAIVLERTNKREMAVAYLLRHHFSTHTICRILACPQKRRPHSNDRWKSGSSEHC